jgi:hypothetical protein
MDALRYAIMNPVTRRASVTIGVVSNNGRGTVIVFRRTHYIPDGKIAKEYTPWRR